MQLLANDPAFKQAFVLGGDWNAAAQGKGLADLFAQTWLGARARLLALPHGQHTGLSGDFSKQVVIDHFAVSANGLGHISHVQALDMPRSPYGEGAPAQVVGASDHVPLLLQLVL